VKLGFAELQGGASRVRIVPALGGKIDVLEIGGRQWLWSNPEIPADPPAEDGGPYVDSGGYDECFPTIGACDVPATVKRYGGTKLPDHGELWSLRPDITVETLPDGQTATCVWAGRRMPYRFTRAVQVTPGGTVVMRYAVQNAGDDPLPFVWSSHPLIALTPETWLDLPAGALVRADGRHGEVTGMSDEFRWPRARLEKKIADMSWPDDVGKGYACKLFLTMPPGPTVIGIEQGTSRLEATFDAGEISHCALWINRRGWSPSRKVKPYANVSLAPCIGAPDSLTNALLQPWDSAQWLAPRAERRWTLTWRTAPARAQQFSPR
jgi:hypothetical protein